ncbi:MAG: DUF3426 domain-containing protein, partial [Proteobacteria bacterium]|nr:DUF3426 domain-containing protein [Pseudomonadota bacterium]
DQRRHFSFRWVHWVPGILVMGCFLGLQFAWFNMDSLSQYPAYRNLYLQVCDYLGCRVTDFSDPGQLQTKNLVIRSHPDESDALIVDVLLRNSAAYPQRFPGLRLRFYDVRGGVVASRVFEVSEYLGGELRGLKYIPARTEVRLALELVDPGEQAMGYEMDVIAGSPTG